MQPLLPSRFQLCSLRRALVPALLIGLSGTIYAQTTGTTNMSITILPEASIVINTATTSLTAATPFATFTGTTSFTYKIRTTTAAGNGTIQLEVTTDFAPANGPSVASPPTASDHLQYTCTVASPGTACSSTVTASTSALTSVGTFGADAHSAAAGNAGSVAWTLTNDPNYKVGSYTAVVTFTISAT